MQFLAQTDSPDGQNSNSSPSLRSVGSTSSSSGDEETAS